MKLYNKFDKIHRNVAFNREIFFEWEKIVLKRIKYSEEINILNSKK